MVYKKKQLSNEYEQSKRQSQIVRDTHCDPRR